MKKNYLSDKELAELLERLAQEIETKALTTAQAAEIVRNAKNKH